MCGTNGKRPWLCQTTDRGHLGQIVGHFGQDAGEIGSQILEDVNFNWSTPESWEMQAPTLNPATSQKAAHQASSMRGP